jgi:8-oxo-dGTP pyrophosphatase MutT (NUDIX family)
VPAFAHRLNAATGSAPWCLRCFLVAENDMGVLVGSRKRGASWEALDVEEPDEAGAGALVLPATHLLEGETPFAAASRVAREQLRCPTAQLSALHVFSHAPSMADGTGAPRLQLCFVYEAKLAEPGTPPWFDELKRTPPRYLRHELFAPLHGDIVADMGFLPPADGR